MNPSLQRVYGTRGTKVLPFLRLNSGDGLTHPNEGGLKGGTPRDDLHARLHRALQGLPVGLVLFVGGPEEAPRPRG